MADTRKIDFVPWAVVAIIALAFLALFLARPAPPPPLDEATGSSGRALTAEQRSVHYRRALLAFEVFPERKAIAGVATLDLVVEEPIERIQFDLDPRYRVARVTANMQQAQFTRAEGRLDIALPERAEAGSELEIGISYEGQPHVARRAPWDGGFVWSSHRGKPWIATAMQGEGCDLLWPCPDNPSVEFDEVVMSITVPEGLSAPGNGKLVETIALDDGRSRWVWRSGPINSYNVTLNVGPFVELSDTHDSRFGNTIPLHFWVLEGNEEKGRELMEEWPDVIDFFEEVVGPYPFADEKLAAVETPHLGMEHQTLNAYGNGFAKAAEGYDWLFHHELAHEWFGNQVTNRDWDEMWLHEGFASYMQPLYLRWRDGEMAYSRAMFNQRAGIANIEPLVSNAPMSTEEKYDEATGMAGDLYAKGSWVLHTLRGLIGDEAFFAATRRLVYGRADPAPGNFAPRHGTTAEFRRYAEEESGRDLKWFFDVYLFSAGLPKLVMEREGTKLRLRWEAPRGQPFPMPLDIRVDGETRTLAMADGSATLPLPDERSRVVIDPLGKVLRVSDAIDRYNEYRRAQPRPPA